ncbi:transmembrane protein 272-like isoform X2 [Cloeon dipterum]|uniref:transmembrane protein 272-like isoform X2 n=1 Tax=Cloeon dipterum TaxID=197152 RepID=UPI0032206394
MQNSHGTSIPNTPPAFEDALVEPSVPPPCFSDATRGLQPQPSEGLARVGWAQQPGSNMGTVTPNEPPGGKSHIGWVMPSLDESAASPKATSSPSSSNITSQINLTRPPEDQPASNDENSNKSSSNYAASCFLFLIILANLICMISMPTIGILYIRDCRISPALPAFLIIGGALIILINVSYWWSLGKVRTEAGVEWAHEINAKLILVFLGWLALSSFWVYKNFEPSPFPEDKAYCNPVLYYFYFWLINAMHLLLFPMCCCWYCCQR